MATIQKGKTAMVTVIKKGSSVKTVLEKYEEITQNSKKKTLKKLCGAITLKHDPKDLQKEWRDEWK